jgi:hypothetical protein
MRGEVGPRTTSPVRAPRRLASAITASLTLATLFGPGAGVAFAAVAETGTITIDRVPFEFYPNNLPHVGCRFRLGFHGFDKGDLNAGVSFHLHRRDGHRLLLSDTVFVGGDDNSGGATPLGIDAKRTYDLGRALSSIPATSRFGWHVWLTVDADGAEGPNLKRKWFWVSSCGSDSKDNSEGDDSGGDNNSNDGDSDGSSGSVGGTTRGGENSGGTNSNRRSTGSNTGAGSSGNRSGRDDKGSVPRSTAGPPPRIPIGEAHPAARTSAGTGRVSERTKIERVELTLPATSTELSVETSAGGAATLTVLLVGLLAIAGLSFTPTATRALLGRRSPRDRCAGS